MGLTTQASRHFCKQLITSNRADLPVRMLSSLRHIGKQCKEPSDSVSSKFFAPFYNKHAAKFSVVTSQSKYIHGCRRVNHAQKVFRWKACSGSRAEFYTNWYKIPLCTTASAYTTTVSHGATHLDASKSSLSALQVKRPVRKKLPPVSDEDKLIQINNVVAYAVAEDIDLLGLEKYVVKQGLYNLSKLPQDVTDALHVRGKYNVEQKPKEIFVFEDGSVVFWCVPETERSAFLKMLGKFSQGTYSSSLILYEKEEIDFTYTSGSTSLTGDMIQLKEDGKDSQHLEMYTISNALAQSVKLALWEASFNKFVVSFESVIEDLREGRKISLSRRQVLMKSGELFTLRHLINMSSDLLDTPDFYWDREGLEPLYRSIYNYLNISRRTRVMNEKLNHCCELTELLSTQLNDVHHTRLEVMIIVLIMVEVVFAIGHAIEGYRTQESAENLVQVSGAGGGSGGRSTCDCELRAYSMGLP